MAATPGLCRVNSDGVEARFTAPDLVGVARRVAGREIMSASIREQLKELFAERCEGFGCHLVGARVKIFITVVNPEALGRCGKTG